MDVPSPTSNTTPEKDLPEKYVRTFAGDMDIVKKGGAPELVPLHAQAPSAPPAAPPPVPSPTSPEDSQGTAPAVAPKPPPVDPLETYSNDFTDRIKKTNASTATVLAAEQDRAQRAPEPTPSEPSPMRLSYLITGAVLLVAGVAGGYVAYTRYTAVSTPVTSAPNVSAPIFVDEREEIAGTGQALLQAVVKSMNRSLAVGTVRFLYLASTTDTATIFSMLPVSVPDVLLRNIHAAGSMAGVINIGGNQSPFFILSISAYSNVFSSMLQWEPLLPEYVAELFPPYAQTPPTAATTTPFTPAPTVTFIDMTVANHDVRAYRDASGRDILVYGFWNQTTLVIARDAAAFTEIVTRLATARTPR